MRYAIALCILLGSTAATAGEAQNDRTGFYFQFNFGLSKIKYDVDEMNEAIAGGSAVAGTSTSKVFSYSMQLGYKLHPNFGLEIGVGSLGESKYEGVTANGIFDIEAKSLSLNAVGVAMFQPTDSIEVYGKGGLGWVRVKEDAQVTSSFGTSADSESNSKSGLTLGLGLKWHLSGGTFLSAELDGYDTGVSRLGKIAVFSIGYGFGH